jgi:signal transduction histidine kinase
VVLLVAVLLLTLGLVAVFAFEAYRADRSHRQVSEQVLKDYVRFAAHELARHVDEGLKPRFDLLDELACGAPERSAAKALADLQRRQSCVPCGALPEAYVRFDPGSGRIVDAAGGLDAAMLAAIERHLSALSTRRSDGLMTVAERERVALLAWRDYGANSAVPVHGILFPASVPAAIIEEILDSQPLLPNALVEPRVQRDYLTAKLRLAGGTPALLGDEGDPSASFSAEATLAAVATGDVRVVASLSAAAADALVIGGLPRSRLPLLATLLCVAAGLIAVAVHQLRREHELARLRDAFVSGVSHELRTPLAQIRLFAETLRLGRVRSREETDRSLAILDEEAERLSQLVDNLLAFNRAGRVATSVELAPLALAPFVADTVERFAPLVREYNNRFVVDIPADLIVAADRDAMARVLTNLIENAVKYGREGQTVRISADEGEQRVRVIIDDEGAGVQRADRRRIWQPFVRGAQRSAATTGTGIGLSVVRDLVAAMGGTVWADEAPAGGARFVVELPAIDGGAQAPLESGATA